ncbi:lactonase family protein [Leeuwenhoekiella sp. W20_SRS_FM14]|uniref:lactonase family protein n=1 Tax=Leeuwenhoekiella sp. W20_SRS_FM14 TaxID=3240270 RepID=UPI003F9C88A7
MKSIVLALSLFCIISCKNTETKTETSMTQSTANEEEITSFYIGTYTDGASKGIYKLALKEDGSFTEPVLAAEVSNPSFISFNKNKNVLLAVNENDPGTIESFQVKADTLLQLNQSQTGGAHPCFVVTNDQDYVLVANYTGGNVGLLKLKKDGSLSELLDVQQHKGKGTTDRQEGPHAHSAWFIPDGSGIISVDLGTNQLWFSSINTETNKLQPATIQKLDFEEGAGPRHLVFHPTKNFVYVLNELNNTVSQIETQDGNYKIVSTTSILPEDFNDFSKAADIHISQDGKFVYASNRGHDSISILEVQEDGSLKLVANEPTRGKDPRNFQITPDEKYIIVANQNGNNLVSYKRDSITGLLTYVAQVTAPAPVCILFE